MPTAKTKPKLAGVPHRDVLAQQMRDPEFRFYYEQRKLVHEVAHAARAMRKGAGLTQAQLAKMVGVSQPSINNIEKGRGYRRPNWDLFRRICIALNKQLRLTVVDSTGDAEAHLLDVQGVPAEEDLAGAWDELGIEERR